MQKVIKKSDHEAEVVDASFGDFISTLVSSKEQLVGAAALCQKGLLILAGIMTGGYITTGSVNVLANRRK